MKPRKCAVARISPDGLHKDVYEFKCEGLVLAYDMYHVYNRSTPEEAWPDCWPDPLSFEKWCESIGLNPDEYDGPNNEDSWSETGAHYSRYCDSMNPVMRRTTDGRVCASGAAGHRLSEHYPLPEGVADEAKAEFIRLLTVKG